MASQTLLSTATVAKVNLLPPEIAENVKARRAKVAMAATVAGAVAVVGVLYVSKVSAVSSARDELAVAKAQHTTLQKDLGELSNVSKVYAQRAAAEQLLTRAMERQVLWSTYLNNLGLTIPDGVWLTKMQVTQTLDAVAVAPGAAAAGAPGATTVLGGPSIGEITFEGYGMSYDDVAAWLDAIGKTKGYSNSYTTKAVEVVKGRMVLVEFKSTVTITPAALSGKYVKPAGGQR